MNAGVLFACLFAAYFSIASWIEGKMSFVDSASFLVILFVVYKIYKTRFVQNLICRLLRWDPVGDYFQQEKERRHREYAEWTRRHNQQMEEDRRRASERSKAIDNAIFHENQAKRYAGTNDGYWHENMAKKYRNDAEK